MKPKKQSAKGAASRNKEVPAAYTVSDLLRIVHACFPPGLAYEWDNVGLQIGNPSAKVTRVMVALEADDRTIALAEQRRCEMLIVHHPLIFRPLKSLRTDDSVARRALRMHTHNMALVVAHTNFDCAPLNMNRAMAEELALEDVRPLEPRVVPSLNPSDMDAQFKFVVFVPRQYMLGTIEAIHRGGGAAMGNYSHAAFSAQGTGLFMPGKDAKPYIGTPGGLLERVAEERIEALVPGRCLNAVVEEVKKIHPYEEAAWDVYKLYAAPGQTSVLQQRADTGLGVVGRLPATMTLSELSAKVAEFCDATYPPMVSGRRDKVVRDVCIMGGSGSSMLGRLLARRPDVFITGEFGYHEALTAAERGISVIALGHANSERRFSDVMRAAMMAEDSHLSKTTSKLVKVMTDSECADPFRPLELRSE